MTLLQKRLIILLVVIGAAAVYLLLGLVGLPVFSGYAGGLCVLFSIYWWVARCLEEISYEQK